MPPISPTNKQPANKEEKKAVSPWEKNEKQGAGESGRPAEWLSAKVAVPAIAILVAVAGIYYYFSGQPSGANVSVEFSKPDQIMAGQPFSLSVSFSNNSDQVLKNAKLSIYLPDNVYYLDGSKEQRVIEKDAGDIGPGSVNPNAFNLMAVGDTQTVKHIDAKLSYQLAGSTAQFEKTGGTDLPIGQQAVELSFETPQKVFSGSDFDLVVDYKNDSGSDLSGAFLKMTYPQGFRFSKSSAQPSIGNNQWNLGDIPKGNSGKLTITGSLVGDGVSSFDFQGTVSANFSGQQFSVAAQTASVSISSSPLSVSLTVNGASDYVAKAGDFLTYDLHYKNNSSVSFENVMVKASLSGEMFDFSSLKTDASFDPIRNVLTWMTANNPSLGRLSPGEEGDLRVYVALKKDFPIDRISDKNFLLKVQTEISSPTVPPGTQAPMTVSAANFETKIAGKLGIQAKAFWRDAASGIVNNGPYPPRVNQATQYTIHWILTNYSTDVSGAQVSAFLQSGARWTGVSKSNTANQPVYDSLTGKVTWDVGDIIATKGVISSPAEAVFQVELVPSSSQLGQIVTFLSGTSVQWTDDFVNSQFSDSYRELTTSLLDDTTIGPSVNRTVQP